VDWQWEIWSSEIRAAGFEPIDPEVRRPGRAVVGAAELVEDS
jgi:hypothetical protein